MSIEKDLPDGWNILKLGSVCTQPQYGYTTSGAKEGNIKLLRTTDITSGNINWEKVPFCLENPKDIDKYLLSEGDIVISRAGSVGVSYLLKKVEPSVFASYLIRFKPIQTIISPKYFYLFLKSPFYWNEITEKSLGIAVANVNATKLKEIEIPVPSIEEQDLIVEKIEELFSELDKGIENLKIAQQQLKVYRQAVLKWAFEGKLTNENVKDGELPEGWEWVTIDQLLSSKKKGMTTGPFGTALKKSEHQLSGVPVLGIENIGEGVFKMPNKIFITNEKAAELKSFIVYNDDIIISRSGTVGEICSVPKFMDKSIISTNLIKVSLNKEIINPKYFVYMFQGGKVTMQVKELCKGSSRAFLNQTILSNLEFPLCSIQEQKEVVQEIESRLSVCDKMEETITNSLQQAEALKQSILKRAFEGKLVKKEIFTYANNE